LIQGVAYGGRYSFAVFFPTLLGEFGWPRDMTASILSLHMLFYGLTAPVAGLAVDRFGTRKTMFFGTLLLTAGLALSGLGHAQWHFYLSFGVLTGVGLCFLGSVPLTMVVRNWFERHRGVAISLVYLGSSLAYGCYPAVDWLISVFGWRMAFVVEGIIVLIVFTPVIFGIMYYHPSMKGLSRDGLDGRESQSHLLDREKARIVDQAWAATDWELGKALKTARFWFCCLLTFSCWGVAYHLVSTHQVAFAMDIGFTRASASEVLSFSALFFALGTMASLWSDRYGRETAMTVGTGSILIGIVALMMAKSSGDAYLLLLFTLFMGFGYGLCVPVVASVVTDIFQGPKVGVILGFIWFSFAMGGTIGPWLGGLLFELFGNYQAAFAITGVMFALGCGAVWLAAPRNIRLVPGRVKAQ